MKKMISLLLTLVLALSLCACGGSGEGETTAEETAAEESSGVTSTDHMTVHGIAVDDSYRDDEDSPLRMVYLFYTLTATDANLQIDSKYTQMTIGETNTYEADNYPNRACDYASSYYYSSYIEDVYVGESLNVIATFKVPEGDLAAGKSITFSDTQNEDAALISMTTDDIQHFASPEEVAQAMDPEGYQKAMTLREPADEETTATVKSQINGYTWTVFVNNTTYEVEFWADNNFAVRSSLGTSSSGTYTVQNGFVFCTYPDTGYTVEIPYVIENGEVDLDVVAGFDVN